MVDAVYDAHVAIDDPAKLAELMAMGLRARTYGDAIVVAPNRSSNRTPSRRDYVVYWDGERGGMIRVKMPCGTGTGEPLRRLNMSEARAALRAIMATPADESSCEACERIIMDDNHSTADSTRMST
jgi:hypothetical protein